MRIRIEHSTRYTYEQPARYTVQELRLTPADTRSQKVLDWKVDAPGIDNAPSWHDAFGNLTHLISQNGDHGDLAISVCGTVETQSGEGIIGMLPHSPPPRIFVRKTPLTTPDKAISALAASLEGKHRDQIALYHALMGVIAERMKFDAGHTDVTTSASQALKAGHGVCQDFAHLFLAVSRCLDLPARYVTGYLVMKEGEVEADAHHAWVEAEVAGLGWVGFDPANGICPDEHYVRLACGLDATSAAPIRGIRRGAGADSLAVKVRVHEQLQQ